MKSLVVAAVLAVAPAAFANETVWEAGWPSELAPRREAQKNVEAPHPPGNLGVVIKPSTPSTPSTNLTIDLKVLVPGGSRPEGSEAAKIQMSQDTPKKTDSRDNEKSPQASTPLNTQNDAPSNQDSGQQSQRNIGPDEQSPEWYAAPLTIFLLAVIGIIVSFHYGRLQVYFAKRADQREIRNATEATLLEQKRERAYLVVERCQMSKLYEGGPTALLCILRNRGKTPATLAEYDLHIDIIRRLPRLPDYKELPLVDMRNITLGEGGDATVQVTLPPISLTPEMVKIILDTPAVAALELSPQQKEEILPALASPSPIPLPEKLIKKALRTGVLTLYFYGCIAYTDAFGSSHRTAFCQRYDPKQDIFIIVNEPGFNFST